MALPPTKPPDPPPSLPENNTIDDRITSPTTSTTEIRHIAADVGQNKFVLHWETRGTHPNALNSTSYDQNLDMGPSPMISEAPKTPRMVSPTSNLTGINTLENVQQISIRDPVGPTKLHAPDPQLGNVMSTTQPKFQPDLTPDAPVGPNFQTEQSLAKQAISPSVDLQIENAPHAQNQHEIMHLPVKNHRTPTRLVPAPKKQLVWPVNPHPDPSSVFPQEDQSALNQGRQTYASAVSGRPTLSQAERNERKSFSAILAAPQASVIHSITHRPPGLHRGEPSFILTVEEEAALSEPFKFTLVGKFSHRKPTMAKAANFQGYMIG